MKRLARVVCLCVLPVVAAFGPVLLQAATGATAFTSAQRRQIVALGPWPPAPARDPGNAWAGRPEAVALGRQLFFDLRLSPDGSLSCATCHVPALAFGDGRPRAVGREALARNTPTLWNAVHARWQGWDGAADSLWSQALRPLLDEREMAASITHVSRTVAGDDELVCRWRRTFGRMPAVDDEQTLVDAGQAIGAFVGSLVSGRTAFDRFRDAVARGDRRAAARYPAAAQRGLKLFIGRGRCTLCHGGPLFSNGEFADIGLPFFVRPGVVDPGRHAGIQVLMDSRYNLLSRWSDPLSAADPIKTRHVRAQHRNFGEFKVPSLRNVADTAPYMHDGQLAKLDDVLQHYSQLDLDRLHADGQNILEPLRLSAAEQADLRTFLLSLSDPALRRWRRPPERPCR